MYEGGGLDQNLSSANAVLIVWCLPLKQYDINLNNFVVDGLYAYYDDNMLSRSKRCN